MSLEFLLALSQGNVVQPDSPHLHRPLPSVGRGPELRDDSPNEVPNLPKSRSSSPRTTTRPRSSSSRRSRSNGSPNLVSHDPSLDSLTSFTASPGHSTDNHHSRLLLHPTTFLPTDADPFHSSIPNVPGSPLISATEDAAARKRRAKAKRAVRENDRPRYLTNKGPISHHLASLIALLHERLMQREYPAAAQLLSVLFRVRKLDAESIFSATTQLLPMASSTPLADMVRFYRRWMTYKATAGNRGKFPPVYVKNAAQVIMQLALLFIHQGMWQHAYDELTQWMVRPPFEHIPVFHGYCGIVAGMLAKEARDKVEEMRAAGVEEMKTASLASTFHDEEDDDVPVSLSQFTRSQASMRSVHSSASAAALVTAQHRMQVYAAEAIRHSRRALALQPDGDAWLYYAMDSLKLNPTADSLSQALLCVHRFTEANPLHPTGWQLKLNLLLDSFPTFASSILTAALHLLSIDPTHLLSLTILQYYHTKQWVSTATLVRSLSRYLDVDAGREQLWKWLHVGLHALQGGASLTWHFVGEGDERLRDGKTDEWEIINHLRTLRTEEATTIPVQSKVEGEEPRQSRGKKRRPSTPTTATKRRRKTEVTTPPPPASTPSSGPVSSTPRSAGSSASLGLMWSPTWSIGSGSSSASALPLRFVLNEGRVGLGREMRGRVEWWLRSREHFMGVRPYRLRGQECGVGDEEELDEVKQCCFALMLKMTD